MISASRTFELRSKFAAARKCRHLMSSLARLAEFIIFNKYREVAEKSIRTYLEYFATKKPMSPETENIDRLVKWYQTDNETRIRYMTWQEEVDDANDRADEAERRADAEKARADAEKARADKYEKMLKDLGKL